MPELFPKGLLNWAGQRSGGVRRLFHDGSGRPAGTVIETPLLERVRRWARGLVSSPSATPRVLLLVGGPGNGKTEAVEAAVTALDEASGRQGGLISELSAIFNREDGLAVPRLATTVFSTTEGPPLQRRLHLVQDASSPEPGRSDARPATLLLEELERHALLPDGDAYLACVNRGVLDEALIAARERGRPGVVEVLEATIRSASLLAQPVSCWPLEDRPWIAVWPMDVESLVAPTGDTSGSPASQLFARALEASAWPVRGECPGGDVCPHCASREALSAGGVQERLLEILHGFELASGKRWTFRDLNSLVSYLLAGAHADEDGAPDPCAWAKSQAEARTLTSTRGRTRRVLAPFLLVSAQYQHALFPDWDGRGARELQRDLKALLDGDTAHVKTYETIDGLLRFISDGRSSSLPATLRRLLPELCLALDPAMAPPETPFASGKTLHELDVRFSQSVERGLQFVRPHRWLSPCEVDLIRRLSDADQDLSSPEVRRKAPAVAARLQLLLRDFACRLVRRSLGVRLGIVKDATLLSAFKGVARGDRNLLHAAARQVEALLNKRDRFELCLNTTFGEPEPPREHRAVLRTLKQKVKATPTPAVTRPDAMTKFITVGSGDSVQSVPMTFELYRAVTELDSGLLQASLPRGVVALLDATKAKLAGAVVRDSEALDDAEITLGNAPDIVDLTDGVFIVRVGGNQ